MDAARSKAAIRAAVLQRRDALSPALRQGYSRAALSRIVATERFQTADVVMAYCGFGSEIDTLPLVEAALQSGKKVVLPKINRAANRLDIFAVRNLQTDLQAGLWGIREPNPLVCASVQPAELDFVLTPGVAFDRQGGRIGYGKGFYDQLLSVCHNAGKRPAIVAAAFNVQVIDAIPMQSHDVPIDAVATEIEYWRCAAI